MKFKFSLEKLLNQRNIQVNLDRRQFLDKQNEYDQVEKKLNEMLQLKINILEQRSAQVAGAVGWQSEVQLMNSFLTGQDLLIEKQNKSLKSLEKEVEACRQILLKAVTEARMVERLKENKKAEFIKANLDLEQKELDEIVSMRNQVNKFI